MKMKSTLIVALLFIAISSVTSYKILFFLAFASKSHRNAFDPVAAELAKRGNEVTILCTNEGYSKEMKGVTYIPLAESGQFLENANLTFFKGPPRDDKDFFNNILDLLKNLCRHIYQEPEVTKMLKNPSAFQYDVVIIDGVFNEFTLPLGHHLSIPNIVFSPGNRFSSLAWAMNIPHPISYLPNGMDDTTDRMTFWQRVLNVVSQVGFHLYKHYKVFPIYDEIIAEFIPNSPKIAELEAKVSFLITNTNPATAPPMPSMPYSIEIGCVHCRPAEPLPKDLEDFLQSSGDAGVIYFSLGSVNKGDSMPIEMRAKIIEAFAKLPQKILWKYETDIENLPKNIKLIKWAPQQDLLEHEKIRLFITHGGGLSTHETIYHKCPVLGFPLSADQWGNMATAAQRGFGEYLDWRTFTVEELLYKIKLILTEDRYQKTADHYSAILRDHPLPPVEKAAYWIEYVARHKGAAHLKSAAENLNFFQYFLLDVIGAILLVIVAFLTVFYLVLRKLCRMFCTKKTTGLKKKKIN